MRARQACSAYLAAAIVSSQIRAQAASIVHHRLQIPPQLLLASNQVQNGSQRRRRAGARMVKGPIHCHPSCAQPACLYTRPPARTAPRWCEPLTAPLGGWNCRVIPYLVIDGGHEPEPLEGASSRCGAHFRQLGQLLLLVQLRELHRPGHASRSILSSSTSTVTRGNTQTQFLAFNQHQHKNTCSGTRFLCLNQPRNISSVTVSFCVIRHQHQNMCSGTRCKGRCSARPRRLQDLIGIVRVSGFTDTQMDKVQSD